MTELNFEKEYMKEKMEEEQAMVSLDVYNEEADKLENENW